MDILEMVRRRDPAELEFHQAVTEVVESLTPVLDRNPAYRKARILERMVEPERVVSFGALAGRYRRSARQPGLSIQMNSAIGPYKGGLRFHPSVNLGILKFLALSRF